MTNPTIAAGRRLDDAQAADLARELYDAETSSTPIVPISRRHPEATIADAYAIQAAGTALRQQAGELVRGRKVGLTAKVMQAQFGVDSPDFGVLMASMFHPENTPLSSSALIAPRVEPEISFVLDRPLRGPGVTVADVLAATAFVVPSLEIIDSRITDWQISIVDTIADNASSARVVIGGTPTPLTEVDIRSIGVVLRRNGAIVETGASAAVLGNPATAVAWLANTLAPFGEHLEAGSFVMPGTCTRAIDVTPGDTVRAQFDGLGDVTVGFVADPVSTTPATAGANR
ncbi:2-keto-4-pentenoate hydratase [Kribbella sp. NPDC051620]|uniref:2-keto-4-pentenoate hydratase n=1 Tax=Kribbella sp. NPDC051620 TaxID=3364120 RepID=UPI00378BEFCC